MAGDPVMGSPEYTPEVSQRLACHFCKGVHRPISTPHRISLRPWNLSIFANSLGLT